MCLSTNYTRIHGVCVGDFYLTYLGNLEIAPLSSDPAQGKVLFSVVSNKGSGRSDKQFLNLAR